MEAAESFRLPHGSPTAPRTEPLTQTKLLRRGFSRRPRTVRGSMEVGDDAVGLVEDRNLVLLGSICHAIEIRRKQLKGSRECCVNLSAAHVFSYYLFGKAPHLPGIFVHNDSRQQCQLPAPRGPAVGRMPRVVVACLSDGGPWVWDAGGSTAQLPPPSGASCAVPASERLPGAALL